MRLILPKIRFSNVKHVPLFVVSGIEFYFWDPNIYSIMIHGRKLADGGFEMSTFGSDMEFDLEHLSLLRERGLWKKTYCPVSVRGKTVLDAGAGCGETSAFYLQRGAERIIAIESNPGSFKLLGRNIERNNWNVVALNQKFDESVIDQFKPDFCKIDVEGGEECLLSRSTLPGPSLIEVHSPELERRFGEKFGMKVIRRLTPRISLMSNVQRK